MLVDHHRRPLRNLRLSVTDRCNLRCRYCMPEEMYAWLPRPQLLDYEEMVELARVFVGLGVNKIRLTGGEPLLRRDLHRLVAQLRALDGLKDLALTTNAVLLQEQAPALAAAGLQRLTVSLDTLDAGRFEQLTQRDHFAAVIAGLDAADAAGFTGTKLNTVVERGRNEDEIPRLLAFARERGYQARFIEYMDVGGATGWTAQKVVSWQEILSQVRAAFGEVEEVARNDAAPADRYRLADGTVFGVIASTTRPFCATCDRSRVTADGMWFHCLYAQNGTDLRTPLRQEGSEAMRALVEQGWAARQDQGAVERAALDERGPLQAPGRDPGDNPHLEMRTRGG